MINLAALKAAGCWNRRVVWPQGSAVSADIAWGMGKSLFVTAAGQYLPTQLGHDSFGIAAAVQVIGLGFYFGQNLQEFGLAGGHFAFNLLQIGYLPVQRAKQLLVVPLTEFARQQSLELIQAETGLLACGYHIQKYHGLGRIAAITIGFTVDDFQ